MLFPACIRAYAACRSGLPACRHALLPYAATAAHCPPACLPACPPALPALPRLPACPPAPPPPLPAANATGVARTVCRRLPACLGCHHACRACLTALLCTPHIHLLHIHTTFSHLPHTPHTTTFAYYHHTHTSHLHTTHMPFTHTTHPTTHAPPATTLPATHATTHTHLLCVPTPRRSTLRWHRPRYVSCARHARATHAAFCHAALPPFFLPTRCLRITCNTIATAYPMPTPTPLHHTFAGLQYTLHTAILVCCRRDTRLHAACCHHRALPALLCGLPCCRACRLLPRTPHPFPSYLPATTTRCIPRLRCVYHAAFARPHCLTLLRRGTFFHLHYHRHNAYRARWFVVCRAKRTTLAWTGVSLTAATCLPTPAAVYACTDTACLRSASPSYIIAG